MQHQLSIMLNALFMHQQQCCLGAWLASTGLPSSRKAAGQFCLVSACMPPYAERSLLTSSTTTEMCSIGLGCCLKGIC